MPTIPGDERQNERLNPGQQDYDRRFNDIAKAEENGTFNDIADNYDKTASSEQEDANIKHLQDNESSSAPTPDWTNNVGSNKTPQTKFGIKSWFKKSSPALGIGGVLGIGGFILLALTSPSLLIVQLKETMVGRFNTQLSSMEARSNKILYAKMNEATSGFCNAKVSIRCKFTTMSEKQVKKLAAAGIEVKGNAAITGRTKPTELIFKGTTIKANEFASTAGRDAEFRSALKQAYNPKYAGFVGKAWANVATKFKINKTPPDLGANSDPDEARKKINVTAKEGVEDTGPRVTVTATDADCEGSACIPEEDAQKINSNAEEVDKAAKDGSAASDVRSKLSGINTGAVSSFFKITGPADYACQAYGALTTLSYAAKAIRSAQLVRYAVIFIGVADAIKAGQAPEPEDVALLGTILTTTIKSETDSSKTLVGSATDSFGYKYAAYGDSGTSKQSMQIANRFIAGGGLTGDLSNFSTTVTNLIGGRDKATATCGFLANPLVQGGSIILGVAALFVPGVNAGKVVASAAAGLVISAGLAILPSMLADIVAGTVTDNIVGEEAGNAITSGSGALMSDALAAQNGNAPMSKEDAIAYNSLQTQTSNQYIADELRETSPFDPTNPHTFVGSIVATLLPLQSKSTPLTTIGSLLNTSVSKLIPSTKAQSNEEYAKTLDVCTDPDIQEAGYAADPFCNVIRGIPPRYLDKDPMTVVDELVLAGDLTEEGMPTGKYTEFIDLCILNEEPLGYANAETGFNRTDAERCIIDNTNANYYLNYVDQRVELGMSGEDVVTTGSSSVANTDVDEANLFTDSTSIACATGTESVGMNTAYNKGKPINIQVCALPNTVLSTKGTPALVNSRASGVAYTMFEQMRADLGLERITINDSFRTMAEQQEAKRIYKGQAATPGYSNHQMGFAFDINMGRENGGSATSYSMNVNSSYPGNPVWEWLKANAGKYHFFQYAPEGWHWSINGG